MAPRSISEIAREANPGIAWKPPWRGISSSPFRLACRRESSTVSGRPRTSAGNPSPAPPASARAPP